MYACTVLLGKQVPTTPTVHRGRAADIWVTKTTPFQAPLPPTESEVERALLGAITLSLDSVSHT